MTEIVRKAYVAGKFYPFNKTEISDQITRFVEKERSRIRYDLSDKKIFGAILPHAGHMYSGGLCVHFFEILSASKQNFDSFLILHPIHRGGSISYASDISDSWKTPLGKVSLDREFIEKMEVPISGELHHWEHSAEVILPFIQFYMGEEIKIIPIGICWQHPDTSLEIAQKIIKAQTETGRKICIIASSDFSHYVDPQSGFRCDQIILDGILDFDPNTVYDHIIKDKISVCGYGPIMSLMYYANLKEETTSAEVLVRGHSGEVYPSEKVVDYVSLLFYYE